MTLKRLPAAALLAAMPVISMAQPIEETRIEFETGTSGATVTGKIAGDEIVDYLLGANAGQVMTIEFETTNPSAYFNLLQGTDPTALFVGATGGNDYSGVLPAKGDYRIRVYLMRSAARRNEEAEYSLSVQIGKAQLAPVTNDYADGLAGGPDWWAVSNVPANDTLNVRSGPGTENPVVGALANGDRVRNLGCRMNGDTKWCQVEFPGDQPMTGWVAGRYLVEATGPSGHEARGLMSCALATGQPMGTCEFRVSRGTGGTASVWVSLPSGGERYMDFRDGHLVGSDPGLSISHERTGDLNTVSINGAERYEFPDAVLYGG